MLMKVDSNKPIRGPKYRSRAFQEYLLRQSPERAAEILGGERTYDAEVKAGGSGLFDPHTVKGRAYQQYFEDLTASVPQEHPAGPGWVSSEEMLYETLDGLY